MNTTNDDLERMLGRELHGRVDGMHDAPLGFHDVRGRAGRIRRTRRIAAGTGLAAAVAILVPAALVAGTGPDRADRAPGPATEAPTPTPSGRVTAIGATAPRGEGPAVSWMEGTVLHQPDGSTTDLGAAYVEVTPYDGGWAAVDLAEGTTSFLDADGEVSETFQGHSLAVSVDGESMASVLTATYGDQDIGLYPVTGVGPGGYLSSVVSAGGTADLAGFTGTQEIAYTLTSAKGHSGAWITDWAQEPRRLPGLINVQAASQVSGVVSGLTSVDELEPGSCSAVVAVDSGRTRWETCDHTLEAFSPDGRHVIGTEDYHDGIGGDTVAILDATDGTVLVEYTTREVGFTGSAVWETSSTALVTTHQDGEWYVLRLSLDGTVERALGPVSAGELDHPWRFGLRP